MMITVEQYWDGFRLPPSTDYADKYQIYCFWDRDTCLYVGQALNINRRLRQHLGRIDNPLYFPGQSMIGHCVRGSLPRSFSWEIELYNNLDLFELTTQRMNEEFKELGQFFWDSKINFASFIESVFIETSCPVFNNHHNPIKPKQHPKACTYREAAFEHFVAIGLHPERISRKRKAPDVKNS